MSFPGVIATEKHTISNLVKAEIWPEHGYCRSVVTVNTTGVTELSVGSVLGTVTESGKYAPRDPSADTGEEVASAVVIENVDVPAATDTEVVVLIEGPAIIGEGALVFDEDHDEEQKGTAIAELSALCIKTKEQL